MRNNKAGEEGNMRVIKQPISMGVEATSFPSNRITFASTSTFGTHSITQRRRFQLSGLSGSVSIEGVVGIHSRSTKSNPSMTRRGLPEGRSVSNFSSTALWRLVEVSTFSKAMPLLVVDGSWRKTRNITSLPTSSRGVSLRHRLSGRRWRLRDG